MGPTDDLVLELSRPVAPDEALVRAVAARPGEVEAFGSVPTEDGELGATVLVHPGTHGLGIGVLDEHCLGNAVASPVETAVAGAHLATSGARAAPGRGRDPGGQPPNAASHSSGARGSRSGFTSRTTRSGAERAWEYAWPGRTTVSSGREAIRWTTLS